MNTARSRARALAPLLLAALVGACTRDEARQSGKTTVPAETPRVSDAPPQKVPKQRIPVYSFELEPKVVDLGTLRPDQDSKFDFIIVNTDARPLRILNVDGSCDCTSFTFDRTEIPPGGRRVVHVDVHAENRGSKLLTAFVQVNDDAITTKQLEIQYVVLAELTFAPAEADFGRRVIGSDGSADVVIRYQLPANTPPVELAPSSSEKLPITWSFDPPEVVDLAGRVRQVKVAMHLKLDGSHRVPAFRAKLAFESKLHRPAHLVVSGEVHPGWYLDHEQVHLGVVRTGKKGRATVRLCYTVSTASGGGGAASGGGDAPKIEALEPSTPELSATSSADPENRAIKIEVVLEPTKSGAFEGDVRVRIDRSAEPLVIRVAANVP